MYHLKYSPPENEEISSRLARRFDDTEEKVKLRLQNYHQNVDDVLSVYKDIIFKVNGDTPKEDVLLKSTRNYLQLLKSNPRTHPSKLLTCDVEDRSNGSAEEMSATANRWSPK